MQTISENTYKSRDRAALGSLLLHARELAKKKGQMQIVSISLGTRYMDPLAVLESIYEPNQMHFYLEHPAGEEAVAGAEAVVEASFDGPDRFDKVREFSKSVLDNTLLIGDLGEVFAGPHFFTSFTFFDDVQGGVFPSARVFLPFWQVARKGGSYSAVANIPVLPEADVESLAARVWAANARFNEFDYDANASKEDKKPELAKLSEVGGQGWYQEAVKNAVERIRNEEFKKIVLARAVDLEREDAFDPMGTLERLREKYPLCFPCSVANGKGQSFIAAAPERLLKVSGGRVQTEAVAGSAPRGKTAAEDAGYGRSLFESDKDLREHQFVIDSIVGHLKSLGMTPEFQSMPRLKKLANVQHLNTPIEAKLPEGIHFLDVAKLLHPTPAVGGAPLEAARAAIAEIENFDRGLYAGAIGWFNYKGEGELVVGIRSALIDGNRARVYAGGGIVQGSNPQREMQETEIKLQAILGNLR